MDTLNRIRKAIKDAAIKGNLPLVAGITTVSMARLKAIRDGAEPTFMEKSMLEVHLQR